MLRINGLKVNASEKEILHGIDLEIENGKKVALMGLNGSGKSTLCRALMGDPNYTITGGRIELDGKDVTLMSPNERAKLGLFLVFQEPEEIDGLSALRFMRSAYFKLTGQKGESFLRRLDDAKKSIPLKDELLAKSLNVTASGGEKKKLEMLQMLVFSPKYALIDEFDSGLDVDSIKIVANVLNETASGSLIVTHNPSVLNHLKVDAVYVIDSGSIVASGGAELVRRIEKEGFSWIQKRN